MGPTPMRRQAARALCLDPEGRVLLLRGADPWDPSKGEWWELPGGAIHSGETSAEAARRELWEEAGIELREIGPCVWVRRTRFSFAGLHFDQDERIHVAWADGGEVRPMALEALEAMAFQGGRWWGLADLLDSDVRTFPTRIREFLPDIVAGRLPPEPVDVGD